MINFESENLDFQKKIRFWFFLGFIFHLICPFLSYGYWHPDEHFQILEFLGTKLYGISGEQLAWEYNAKIRPWFQVWSYYWWIKPLKFANPFFLASLIRLSTSLLAFVSMIFLTRTVFAFFKNETQKHYWLIFITLFWFMPFLHARSSSENFSAALFFIGMSFFLERRKLFFAGVLFGLSFMSRFQMGLLIFPLFAWSVIFGRNKLPLFGLFIGILLGVLADYLGYGEWVFTPWNYLKVNILENKVSSFGTSPFWWYFTQIATKGGGPLGLVLLIATLWGWKNYPKNPLTWISVFYFFIHCFIGHKEFRFLTPLFPLSIFYLVLWIPDKVPDFFQKKSTKALVFLNMALFLYFTFAPATFGLGLKSKLFAKSGEIKNLYTSESSPYKRHGTYDYFYMPKNLNIIEGKTFDMAAKGNREFWFGTSINEEIRALLKKEECEIEFSSYPKFILNFSFKQLKKNKPWVIFKCVF